MYIYIYISLSLSIHPASRGVAAHTAGLFRSVAREFSLFPPVGASQAREFSLFPAVTASQAMEFSLFPREAFLPPPCGGSPS